MVVAALYVLLRCATVRYPSTEKLKYSNYMVNPSKYVSWRESPGELLSSMYTCVLRSGPYVIINACDTMQNLGQTQIFYKLGQSCLTQTKCDLVDPDKLAWFQPWYECCFWVATSGQIWIVTAMIFCTLEINVTAFSKSQYGTVHLEFFTVCKFHGFCG